MLAPEAAELGIAERAHLSKDALLSLISLLASLLDTARGTHDNLQQTVVGPGKGGHRAATATSGSDPDRRGSRAHRGSGANRTGRSHGPHSSGGLSSRKEESG